MGLSMAISVYFSARDGHPLEKTGQRFRFHMEGVFILTSFINALGSASSWRESPRADPRVSDAFGQHVNALAQNSEGIQSAIGERATRWQRPFFTRDEVCSHVNKYLRHSSRVASRATLLTMSTFRWSDLGLLNVHSEQPPSDKSLLYLGVARALFHSERLSWVLGNESPGALVLKKIQEGHCALPNFARIQTTRNKGSHMHDHPTDRPCPLTTPTGSVRSKVLSALGPFPNVGTITER